ncbi:type 1 glutamine amidotransferase [Pseudomonadota bacterium]
MRIHYLKHVPFEGLGCIEMFLLEKGHRITHTALYEAENYPDIIGIEWLIVMGGPMGIYDESEYPWLRSEKAYIKEAIAAGKIVLGICLGAQLIADVLGAKIYKNQCPEIGWFPITRSSAIDHTLFSTILPKQFDAFHWHGDTFDIPSGGQSLGKSEACQNQGFVLDNRIAGFQFHLETTPQSARALIDNCHGELDGSAYVQTETEMLADEQKFAQSNKLMRQIIECLQRFSDHPVTP